MKRSVHISGAARAAFVGVGEFAVVVLLVAGYVLAPQWLSFWIG